MADEMQADEGTDPVAIQWVTHPGDRAHIREMRQEDWAGLGMDHPTVSWDRMSKLTKGQAWVSPRAAEYLLEVEPGFARVEEKDLAFAMKQKQK